MYKIQIIDKASDFKALQTAWEDLVDKLASPSVFFSYDWVQLWIECFSAEGLHILIFWEGNRLAGIFPLCRVTETVFKFVPRRRLKTITSECTPTAGLIVQPGDVAGVMEALVVYVKQSRMSCDDMLFEALPYEAGFVSLMKERFLSAAFQVRMEPWGGSYSVTPGQDFDSFFGGLGRVFRKSMGRKFTALKAREDVRYEVHAQLDESLYSQLRTLENTGWKRERGYLMQHSGARVNFFRRLADVFSRRGQFRLFVIYIDRIPAVMEFCLIFKGTLHSIKIAVNYDEPSFRKLSLGQLSAHQLIKYSCENGLQRIDFCGPHAPDQVHWHSVSNAKQNFMAYPRNDIVMKLSFLGKDMVAALKGGLKNKPKLNGVDGIG